MEKIETIGVIETQYYTVAIEILDQVCKGSNVTFLTSENYLGGMLVTLIVSGSTSDVHEAISIAKQVCQNKPNNPLKMAIVISNPHPEILKFILPIKQEIEDKQEKPAKIVRNRKPKPNLNANEEE